VSLEIGRSPADRDDREDTETAGTGSGASRSGSAEEPSGPRPGTGSKPLRGSVLAPFMAAGGGAESSPAEQSSVPAETDPAGTDEPGTGGTSAAATAEEAIGADVFDGPLLSDAAELRANWLRVQAHFVDDPRGAVSDAADLVEHTTQALVGALRLRQRQLREMWDGGRPRAGSGRAADGDGGDPALAAVDSTEQLRLLVRRYRVLFNQICRP
jgi:hypothetical protein